MPKSINLTGLYFGRLKVLEKLEYKVGGNTVWSCICECGSNKIVAGGHLRSGKIRSCGCLRKEITGNRAFKHGASQKKHLGTNQQLDYIIWRGIKARCYNKNAINYDLYGGRGIKMYSKWIDDFIEFAKYIRTLPNCLSEEELISRDGGKRARLSLDRIKNNKSYIPNNLRWATPKEQSNNRRARRK